MTIYMYQASIDEHGRISGGAAGNQSGSELNCRPFSSRSDRPWQFMVRLTDPRARAQAVAEARNVVGNPFVGYDQYQRNTLMFEAEKVGWHLDRIKTPCETDCAAMDAVVDIAAIYLTLGKEAGDFVKSKLYAGGNLPATMNFKEKALQCAPYLEVLPYTGPGSLLAGDSLIRDGHAVKIGDGAPTSTASGATGDIAVDGWFGPATVTKAQRTAGTTVDGEVSGQDASDMRAIGGVPSTAWKIGRGGSQLVKFIQDLVGSKPDGYFGPITCGDFHEFYGLPRQTYFDHPDEAVRRMQAALNKGGFK